MQVDQEISGTEIYCAMLPVVLDSLSSTLILPFVFPYTNPTAWDKILAAINHSMVKGGIIVCGPLFFEIAFENPFSRQFDMPAYPQLKGYPWRGH